MTVDIHGLVLQTKRGDEEHNATGVNSEYITQITIRMGVLKMPPQFAYCMARIACLLHGPYCMARSEGFTIPEIAYPNCPPCFGLSTRKPELTTLLGGSYTNTNSVPCRRS